MKLPIKIFAPKVNFITWLTIHVSNVQVTVKSASTKTTVTPVKTIPCSLMTIINVYPAHKFLKVAAIAMTQKLARTAMKTIITNLSLSAIFVHVNPLTTRLKMGLAPNALKSSSVSYVQELILAKNVMTRYNT